ncbi:MAG: nitroreductase family protein [Anaerovoracaceae bacterium]
MNALFKRRSIRKYIDKEVSDADLELLLKAAMCAPSAGNEQPWEFIVVRDREIMKRVSEFHPYSKMLHEASAAIVVCGNRSRQVYDRDYWQLDCSAATQNILIQATDMKIGSVWLAVYPEPDRIKGAKEAIWTP